MTDPDKIAAAERLTSAWGDLLAHLATTPGHVIRAMSDAVHEAETQLDPTHLHYPPEHPTCPECMTADHAPHDHPDSMPWRAGCPACETHALMGERQQLARYGADA